ncbi:DNA-directed RNA polymerase III subunit rpc3 [Carica papaya]|uniref:DNA-directed RNA polymerase III subunit rpc3 n=1 Tax=Carica papaya TaxID=3649 RepID=UPI000B8C8957|nr:DNA-directed RNA polymerase III subunit rpc3 [Carica papaya]
MEKGKTKMVLTQYAVKYAVHIITKHFGNLVAKVCECLLRKGALTLPNIVRFTELNPSNVKNCLLVLIQHNCVQAFVLEEAGTFGDGPKVNTQYIALFDNIIHRVRFSKFLMIVSKDLGQESVALLEGLLQHGRLTLQQMLDRAESSQNENAALAPDEVRETLLKLVAAHYVERCPAPQPVIAMPTEEESAAKRRASKSAKIIEERETLEQRVVAASIPGEVARFSFTTDVGPDSHEENEDDFSSLIIGEKRKRDAVESDKGLGATDEQTVLWRVSFEEFARRLRHKACIENVRARLDDGAATVLAAMLEASRSEENKLKTEKSVPLSLNSIYEEVIKSEAGRNMTIDRVSASLVQLGSPPFVREFDESYSVDFKHIIELAQNHEVESVVLKRYGRDAYRMFRLLLKAGRLLETDKIADSTFVEKKDAPKILYKLWKDEYLHMEKLVVTGARQAQFLLWKVNKRTLWEHVLDEMFHAALNLNQRLAYELEQEKELLSLPSDKRVGELNDRFNRIRKVRLVLESSQIQLDDAVLLFHYF